MQGLDFANRLMNKDEREGLLLELQEAREKRLEADERRAAKPQPVIPAKIGRTVQDANVFVPKDLMRRI